MTERLELPKHFSGSWEHLLVLTYGLDAPFFESSIWSELPARCRNKIILADGQHYLEACATYAKNRLARYINQKYVVDGIYLPKAAHAKIILLTRPDEGRLLVGSGNLNWQGYASGGELFTHYQYSSKQPEAISAFLAVWDMVEELIRLDTIGPAAIPYLQRMHEQTPWLFRPEPGDSQPVRSNLHVSFLQQLQEAVGNEPVSELWVMAPFYDQQAQALKKLLETFSPQQVHLVVQAEFTSLDPDTVLSVMHSYTGNWEINPFAGFVDDDARTYEHAKLYLLKTPTRTICLQGSPNLSQVAMLLAVPQGNFEVANLGIGVIDAYDDLLRSLNLTPATRDFSALGLAIQPSDKIQPNTTSGWQLISADWQQDQLRLYFHGDAPELPGVQLQIDKTLFQPVSVEVHGPLWIVRLSPEAQQSIEGPVPVAIVWEEDGTQHLAGPVFPCNSASLAREMQAEVTDDRPLARLGDLDLEDAELEKLLAELGSALPIDRRSIWQLAGKPPPTTNPDGDDCALHLSYLDVDYNKLRQHPKILQYSRGRYPGGESEYTRSRLQIILSSITDHFQGLWDIAHGKAITTVLSPRGDSDEGEEEPEQAPPEKGKTPASKGHVRRILKSFIRRYLRGLKSKDFLDLVGFEVVANNYVIFSHVLWRLLNLWNAPEKGRDEREFILEAFLDTWEFIWGTGSQRGYLAGLDDIERELCLQLIREQHTDAQAIAAIYYGTHLCQRYGWKEKRLRLRNFYRQLVSQHLIDIDTDLIEASWIYGEGVMPYQQPSPGSLFQNLADLARYETQSNFLKALEHEFGLKEDSCEIDREHAYYQPHLQKTAAGDCLIIKDATNALNKDVVIHILRFWIDFQVKDYYRIVNYTNTIICWYCPSLNEGVYYQSDPPIDEDLDEITPVKSRAWEVDLLNIQEIAGRVDQE